MNNSNPGNAVFRKRVAPMKINSIYIDFTQYNVRQTGGNNQNQSPRSNTSGELEKSAQVLLQLANSAEGLGQLASSAEGLRQLAKSAEDFGQLAISVDDSEQLAKSGEDSPDEMAQEKPAEDSAHKNANQSKKRGYDLSNTSGDLAESMENLEQLAISAEDLGQLAKSVENSGELAKSGEDSPNEMAKEKSAEDSGHKKTNQRKKRGGFNLRKFVAEKSRKEYVARGELLPLEPNSNEAPANPSPIQNTTVTTGVADENQQREKNTLEDPKRRSLSKALGKRIKEEAVDNSAGKKSCVVGKKGCVVGKRPMGQRKQKTRLMVDIYQTTKRIDKILPEEPPNHRPTFQRRLVTERTTSIFQVVNVVEDFNIKEEEEEDGSIRIRRRRKHA